LCKRPCYLQILIHNEKNEKNTCVKLNHTCSRTPTCSRTRIIGAIPEENVKIQFESSHRPSTKTYVTHHTAKSRGLCIHTFITTVVQPKCSQVTTHVQKTTRTSFFIHSHTLEVHTGRAPKHMSHTTL